MHRPRRKPAGSFRAWGKHLHWGFVREDDVPPKQAVAQGIDQGLQLDTASADPLRQRGARDGQPGAGEDLSWRYSGR